MGDRDNRALEVFEHALEPRHALGVEVVGRFVEQQHVGLAQQQATQRHAALLATRDLGDIGIAGRAAQRIHRHVDGVVELPRVGSFDRVLQAPLLLEQLLHLRVGHVLAELHRNFFEAREQLAGLGDTLVDVALHVLLRVELRLLWQVADLEPRRRPRLAEEVLVLACHDAQQRRLTGAVVAEHADLRARVERQPDALQDLALGRDDLAQILHHVRVLGGHGVALYRGCRIATMMASRWLRRPRTAS